jgi:hypothetical protein
MPPKVRRHREVAVPKDGPEAPAPEAIDARRLTSEEKKEIFLDVIATRDERQEAARASGKPGRINVADIAMERHRISKRTWEGCVCGAPAVQRSMFRCF